MPVLAIKYRHGTPCHWSMNNLLLAWGPWIAPIVLPTDGAHMLKWMAEEKIHLAWI